MDKTQLPERIYKFVVVWYHTWYHRL